MENEELVDLIKAGHGVKQNMGTLYQQNRGFILRMVKRYELLADREDLLQEAYFLLDEAVKTYDPARGKFVTWLGNTITWKLPRLLIDNNIIIFPYHMYERYVRYNRIVGEYTAEHGEEPSEQIIMQMMGIDEKELQLIKRADKMMHKASLQVHVSDDTGEATDDTLLDLIPDESDPYADIDDGIDNRIYASILQEAMSTLTEQQKNIIELYCMAGIPYQEAQERLNIRHRQQLFESKKNALKKIRKNLIRADQLQTLYEDAYCGAYRGSLSTYKSTQTSTPEKIALNNMENAI